MIHVRRSELAPFRVRTQHVVARLVVIAALTHLTLAAAPCAAAQTQVPPDGTVRGELATRIDEHLRRASRFGFAGAVLIVQKGDVILHKGYGLADREAKRPVTVETVFDIGSITKPFTAAAILKLEELGRLRVTDSIRRYFDVPADKAGITIHHLLTHTSGLRDVFGGDYSPISRDSLVRVALASTLLSAPGARYEYSNAGYSLLGAIVEIVSGQPYEQFLHERLLRPAGLQNTGYRLVDWSQKQLAVGYRGTARFGTPLDHAWAPDGPYWHLRANGGLLSTVGDLYRWHRALADHHVLSATSFAKATTPHAPSGSSYGYGWGISRTPKGGRVIGHNGANGYFYALTRHYLDDSVSVIFATNDNANRSVERAIIDLVFGQQVQEIPAEYDASVPLERYVGSYRTKSGVVFETRIVGESLEISPAPSEVVAAFVLRTQDTPQHTRTATFDSVVIRTVAGMATEDFAPYRERFLPVGNYQIDGEVEFWTEVFKDWRESYGEYRNSHILGTTVVRTAQGPTLATYVAVRFARGERVIRIFQTIPPTDKFFVATVPAASWPSRYPLVPSSATEFSNYNFELGRATKVTFLVDDGRVRSVVLPGGEQAEKIVR